MSDENALPVKSVPAVTEAPVANDRLARMISAKEVFLGHLAKSGNVSESAHVAGVERSTLYGWRDADPIFAGNWEAALEDAVDLLEAEARRRAVEGYDEPILSKGHFVRNAQGIPVMRRKYSDGLLSFLLRAHRPGRFRDNGHDGKAGMITITITPDDSVL